MTVFVAIFFAVLEVRHTKNFCIKMLRGKRAQFTKLATIGIAKSAFREISKRAPTTAFSTI